MVKTHTKYFLLITFKKVIGTFGKEKDRLTPKPANPAEARLCEADKRQDELKDV